MIVEIPLPDNPKILERWAISLGWKPVIAQQRSETEEGVVTVIDTPNPEDAEACIIRKQQEACRNAYGQRVLDVNRSALVENAKKEAEELGIVGYKEEVVIPK